MNEFVWKCDIQDGISGRVCQRKLKHHHYANN
jgi:hypothetical protein